MAQIAYYDIESNYTPYKVELYPEKAQVWVLKTNRQGNTYMQAIKHGSGTFRRVLRDLRLQAQPGSLGAEQLAQCADTSR